MSTSEAGAVVLRTITSMDLPGQIDGTPSRQTLGRRSPTIR